ncbi:hypothetical protein [Ekhidna sp.]
MKNLTAIFIFCIAQISFSQEVNPKWNKVSKSELELKSCPFDSTADAMVLSKTGNLTFLYVDDIGWKYKIEVTKRVKIFNTEGKNMVTFP